MNDLFERIGEDLTPNDIKEVENKEIRLVEERGVAAFPYKNVVKEIFEYIKDYCGTLPKDIEQDEKSTFDVPSELTSKIDFINDLTITVEVTNTANPRSLNMSGAGESFISLRHSIVDGKLNFAKINLHCYAYYGQILERTVYNSLYHELNHYYEAYKDLTTNGYYRRYITQAKKATVQQDDIFDDADDNQLFNEILYRLFSETEFNALVSGVYGDLQGLDSSRENFQKDIRKTQAYFLYKKIATNYKLLVSRINDNNIEKVKYVFNKYGIKLNPYGNSTESFKKELSRKINYLLKDLIKRIGRTASLYYDNKEEEFPPLSTWIRNEKKEK